MRSLPLCVALTIAQLLLLCGIPVTVSGLGEQLSHHEGKYGTAGLVPNSFGDPRASWSYSNLSAWPQLCLTGSRQSPISFTHVDPAEVVTNAPLRQLQFSSECIFPRQVTQVRIVNEGEMSTVRLEEQGRSPDDLSDCTVRDPLNASRVYHFNGLTFHGVPVHRLRMLRPAAEMHISFAEDGSDEKKHESLMVAVMLEASATTNSTSARALSHILAGATLPPPHAMTTCFLAEDLSISSLFPERQSYLLYDGSQTHPPCTENVRWVVMTSPVSLPPILLVKLRDSAESTPNGFQRLGNARHPQPLNGRLIYRFDDKSARANDTERKSSFEDALSRHGEDMSKRAPDALRGSVPARSIADGSRDKEISSNILATPVLPSSGWASGNNIVRPSSPLTNYTLGSSSGPSSSHEVAKPVTETPSPAPVSGSKETDAERPSWADDSHTGGSHATANSSSASLRSDAPSASSSRTDDSLLTGPPLLESSSQMEPNHSTPHPTAMATSTTTTSTKSPSGNGRKRGASGGASSTPNAGATLLDSITSFAKSAWAFVKAAGVRAFQVSVAYAEANPLRAGLILLGSLVLIYLIRTCCNGWRRPVYVVGINPSELQPLNSTNQFDRYGGTGTSAVRPANSRSA
ncbi:hypothetical protein LSCM1_03059 [Leishmania martiniquensis]|uniref:carbonic anhydrase n=1 Tax=Leishmania martiniquensis TaxID=1580590 RepID=A0A836GKZ1_9TRYP|nr:hypothetical protein LSCM1_03059 [Leishmania martiniquensis]